MDIIKKVEEYVKKQSELYKLNADDHYDFWNEHIKYVYDESVKLAKEYHADIEIVSLGALLHDMALVNKVGDRKDHHVNGVKIAKEVLTKFKYDENKMEQVLQCVYNHRSSKNAKSIEEICVADADVLAHFDNIPMLFNSAFMRNNVSLGEIKPWMKQAFEKDFNDLSESTQKVFKEKYEIICQLIINE